MKRLLVAFGVLLSLVVVSFLALIELKNISEEITEQLHEIENCIDSGDTKRADEISNNVYEYFLSKTNIMIYFLEHDHLEELEETLSRLSPLCLGGDLSEFSAEVSKAKSLVEKLYEHELPILKNIL